MIYVNGDDKVKRIIQRVREADTDPNKKMVLMFAGRVLENKKTISECNVHPGAVLEVIPRMYRHRRHHASDDTYEWDKDSCKDDTPVNDEIDDHADSWIEEHDRAEYKRGHGKALKKQ